MLLPALLPVGLAGTVAVLAAPSAALATPAAAFSPAQRAALEARLSAGLQRVVDRQPRIDGQGQAVVVVARFNARGDTLVVDAAHGIYFHHEFDDWRAQRDPSNGITEDFLTPGLATELSTWLSARSGATSTFPRSTEATLHTPNAQAWWQIAARYRLEVLYPELPAIWHSLPDATHKLRERDEDIRSRPLLAEHLGPNTLIHRHTDAAGPTASGSRACDQTGRTTDQQLGDSVPCSMQELIQAREPDKTFPVARSAQGSDKGENRLATMPSKIVEVGFHTNPPMRWPCKTRCSAPPRRGATPSPAIPARHSHPPRSGCAPR